PRVRRRPRGVLRRAHPADQHGRRGLVAVHAGGADRGGGHRDRLDETRTPHARPAAPPPKPPYCGDMPSVQGGDIDVYYEIHGDGPPLVFIGGLGVDLTVFASVTSRLAHTFRVLTFDNRGAGRTDKPDAPYSIPMMAEDTIGLMNTLGIGRAH